MFSIRVQKLKRTETFEDWMDLTVGVRYDIHPATIGEYSVTSNDGSYSYYDIVEYELHEAYSNFSPEVSLNYGMFGVSYAYQKHPTENVFHTIWIKIQHI